MLVQSITPSCREFHRASFNVRLDRKSGKERKTPNILRAFFLPSIDSKIEACNRSASIS